eukprot:999342-Rhodomonas_salina.1
MHLVQAHNPPTASLLDQTGSNLPKNHYGLQNDTEEVAQGILVQEQQGSTDHSTDRVCTRMPPRKRTFPRMAGAKQQKPSQSSTETVHQCTGMPL